VTPTGDEEVTYYTVADHGFFLGAVALLNSLRLTRNAGRVVVLDAGLTPEERDVLADHATVVTPPRRITGNPVLMKPYAHFLEPSGIVVVIDSDIIVTGSLDVAVALAREGKICAFPAWARHRWYAEWEEMLKLRAPLRREEHVNSGFVAFSTRHWPDLLKRWWELCELVPAREVFGAGSVFFYAGDQDALNALLMSEISREAVARLPDVDSAFAGHVAVDDIDDLVCTMDGHRTTIVHYLDSPKPWQPSGWLRLAATSYLRLLKRL